MKVEPGELRESFVVSEERVERKNNYRSLEITMEIVHKYEEIHSIFYVKCFPHES